MKSRPLGAIATIALWIAGATVALAAEPTRGQLLYETHCSACHGRQMHWREQSRVTDWASLYAQVLLWQARAQLNWSDADIDAVAAHLNDTIYRLPRTEQRASLPGPAR